MAFYDTGFCQNCSKVRDDTDNERGLCRSCVVYLYPDSDEAAVLRPVLDAEHAERLRESVRAQMQLRPTNC